MLSRKPDPVVRFIAGIAQALLLTLFVWLGWDLFASGVKGLPLIAPWHALGLVLTVAALAIVAVEASA